MPIRGIQLVKWSISVVKGIFSRQTLTHQKHQPGAAVSETGAELPMEYPGIREHRKVRAGSSTQARGWSVSEHLQVICREGVSPVFSLRAMGAL